MLQLANAPGPRGREAAQDIMGNVQLRQAAQLADRGRYFRQSVVAEVQEAQAAVPELGQVCMARVDPVLGDCQYFLGFEDGKKKHARKTRTHFVS